LIFLVWNQYKLIGCLFTDTFNIEVLRYEVLCELNIQNVHGLFTPILHFQLASLQEKFNLRFTCIKINADSLKVVKDDY